MLVWWKTNQFRFPVLSQMARDVLTIPLSTVASESAFNVGGRVLDACRSSLNPETVEAVICLRDWVFGQGNAFIFLNFQLFLFYSPLYALSCVLKLFSACFPFLLLTFCP